MQLLLFFFGQKPSWLLIISDYYFLKSFDLQSNYSQNSQVDNFSFTISGAAEGITSTSTLTANTNVKYGDLDCSTDYLHIAGGSETGASQDQFYSKDRFCGTALGFCKETTAPSCSPQLGAVTTFTKPFIVGVVTNENEATASKSNRGFNLLYSQQPCLSSG